MTDETEWTIRRLGKSSSASITFSTCIFALGGAALASNLVGHWDSGFWPIWIPFCFFIIPAIYHLSRELIKTRARLADLEAKLNSIHDTQKAEQVVRGNGG